MAAKIFQHAKFNLDALLSLSEALRGQTCTCDTTQRPKSGSLNWVIFITFTDGVEWVFRSPRSGPRSILTDESASKMLISEVATLRYLKVHSSVPVPEVKAYNGFSNSNIGVPFILMSKAPGRPLCEFDWHEISRQTPGYPSLRPLTPLSDQQREKIMVQLGTIMAQLSMVQFDKIGSLFEDDQGRCIVGECLSPTLLWQNRDTLDGIDRGPFLEERAYLNSLISAFQCHSKELPLTPHLFFAPIPHYSKYTNWSCYLKAVRRWNDFASVGSQIEQSENRLSYCIAGQFLREMTPSFSTTHQSFTLSHPDLHLGNIFVDESLNITCLIDWGSASSGPITELIATPGLDGTTLPPLDFLVAAFRSAFRGKSQVTLEYWEKADMMWYFSRLVRMLSTQDYTLFQALYKLVHKSINEVVNIPILFQGRGAREENKHLFMTLKEDDPPKEDVQQHERAAFSAKPNETNHLAVARKLTVMSQINRSFIADERLWHWLEVVLDQD